MIIYNWKRNGNISKHCSKGKYLVSDDLAQSFPTFLWPSTPSEFWQISMYSYISYDKNAEKIKNTELLIAFLDFWSMSGDSVLMSES